MNFIFGTVSSFLDESGKDLRWSVDYGSRGREELGASQLHEKLRIAVVVDDLVAIGKAFLCSDCSTCFQTSVGLRYLRKLIMISISFFIFS